MASINPDYNRLHYLDVLETKTNATSDRNIGSLKTVYEEEWKETSEEFILKTCKSFRRRVDTMTEKNDSYIEWINRVSCYFVAYFQNKKITLFYKRVVYHWTRIFLILRPRPVS